MCVCVVEGVSMLCVVLLTCVGDFNATGMMLHCSPFHWQPSLTHKQIIMIGFIMMDGFITNFNIPAGLLFLRTLNTLNLCVIY